MNVKFENVSDVQGLLTVSMQKADYEERVSKALKATRQKANMPGFRPGMVPMQLIQKLYGKAIKADEINKLLQETVYNHIKENKIDMLGEPLPNEEKEKGQSLDSEDLTFYFDLALAPKFDASLSKDDKIPYYEIKVSDEMIESQVKTYTQRGGNYEKVDSYQDNDMIKGQLTELDAEGNVKEDGIVADAATVMPSYIPEETEKILFDGIKVGDEVRFNPAKAYQDNQVQISTLLGLKKEEVADIKSDFLYKVNEITRFQEAPLNQELFDQVFGKDAVKSEAEFRSKISEQLAQSFGPDSDYRFLIDVREYLMSKIGKLQYADELLKRIMKENRQDGDDAKVEENYEASIKELTWHLIKEQLVEKNGIKIEEEDIKNQAREAVRAQFVQYGMMNIPDELLDNYAQDMLKKKETVDNLVNRAVEVKLSEALKGQVKLNKKKVSMDEFNKLFQPATAE